MDNSYHDTKADPMFTSFEEMEEFMQRLYPPTPTPKEIRHVVMDADDTIWDIEPWGMASLAKPIGKTDSDVLPVILTIDERTYIPSYWQPIAPIGSVKLDPKLRDTLKKLKEKGIKVSIASNNSRDSVLKYLEAFGLRDSFTDVEASFIGSKDKMVEKIAKRNKVDTSKMLFVDDNPYNGEDVALHTNATSLILGYNIDNLDDILEFIK